MYFSGIGNDSSLGTKSLTLGSVCWRKIKSPVKDQKSFLAFASSSVESSCRGVGEENPSDSPRRTSCSSPRSGRHLVKVCVLRRHSLPKICTVPSATGNIKLSPFIDINTSFVLSLLAWSSYATISSNSSSISATLMSPFQSPPADNTYPRNLLQTGQLDR